MEDINSITLTVLPAIENIKPANKCLLRTVVKEIVKSKPGRLFYFPSFEMVLCDNPYNFCADNRHVKHATVNRIFSVLKKSTGLQSFR